ncbi:MAG: hypothetical protein AB7O96_06175 [Pseudobdellovibrionaceae bacterium]
MRLDKSTRQDEKELAEFFSGFPTQGPVEVRVDRYGGFSAPYHLQSDDAVTYMLRDAANKVQGCASFVTREVLLNMEPQRVTFGHDLRISSSRKAILEWSHHFLPVMEEVFHEHRSQLLLTALNMREMSAYNAFIRPRPHSRPLPRYHLFAKFNFVTVHGRWPWAPPPLPHLRVLRGTEEWIEPLSYFLRKNSTPRMLSSLHRVHILKDRLTRWPGFSIENFYIAVDHNNQIRGCMGMWSPEPIYSLYPTHYTKQADNLRQFLKVGRAFGWAHTLPPVKSKAPFHFHYLTHLFVENESIFESLLHEAYNNLPKYEFMAYLHFEKDWTLKSPPKWITTSTPYGLYMLLPPDSAPPDFINPTSENKIELESCFIF